MSLSEWIKIRIVLDEIKPIQAARIVLRASRPWYHYLGADLCGIYSNLPNCALLTTFSVCVSAAVELYDGYSKPVATFLAR